VCDLNLPKKSLKLYLLCAMSILSRNILLVGEEVSNNHEPTHLRYTFFIMRGY